MNIIKFPVRGTNDNVIDIEWIKNENIGIVLAEDGWTRVTSAYVGPIIGENEQENAEHIVRTGTKLTKSAAEAIFGPQHFFKQ